MMATVRKLKRDLAARRQITVVLPEFLVAALEHRVAQANMTSEANADITLDHVVELELAESLSIAEVALMESSLPGISDAVSRWLSEID